MKEQKNYPFCKMYKGLMLAFTPPESVFMIYMADLAALQEMGHNTVRSKKKHMAHTNIGYRVFDQCVRKTIRMGLLERIPVDGMFEYVWDIRAYERLLLIVNAASSYVALKEFCDKVFDKEKRTVTSVTNEEIKELSMRRF